MEQPPAVAVPEVAVPPLKRDPSFLGMLATQFLGAFNDNVFKQLVLLICIGRVNRNLPDAQGTALILFAVPFVLFSGFGGFLSDRYSKRTVVVLCKVAEIVVMLLGMAAFLGSQLMPDYELTFIFAVLFLMSLQSALFGPSKYGILPEMLRAGDLPAANGMIQMTTFLAIIFGTAVAGYAKEWFDDRLWIISVLCVGIAVAGTLTSLFIRRTPIAHAGLSFEWGALGVSRETWRMVRDDHLLLKVLLTSSLFWFLGGVVQPAVNAFGKQQLGLPDGRTSLLSVCMGIGIAIGCGLAARLSHRHVNFRLVNAGAAGIVLCLLIVLGLGFLPRQPLLVERAAWGALTGLGIFAGLFIVPLQVFMQSRPPQDQKGRMIGVMNFVNWIGIVISAVWYSVSVKLLQAAQAPTSYSLIFGTLALLVFPIVLWRPHVETPSVS